MFERLLIRYPLFELLEPVVLQALLDEALPLTFEAGDIVFQEGSAGAWVHFLVEGRVRILRRSESGREISLGTVRDCELFGEYALLMPHQHTATARASATSKVLRLPLQQVRRALQTAGVDGYLLKQFIRLHASMHFATGRHYLGFMSAPSALTYSSRLQQEHFRALRTLCGPGLAKDRWFLILAGAAVLTDRSGHSHELGPGDCFGSHCLTGRDPGETVSTLSAAECLSLRSRDFAGPQGSGPRSGATGAEFSGDGSGQSLSVRPAAARDFPFIPQCHEADCGLAALAMVLQYHGCSARHNLYSNSSLPSDQGFSLLQLRNLARLFAFSAEAYRVDMEHVQDVTCPFIAHLNDGHYVVVYHTDNRLALVADPATGVQSISLSKLQENWSGYSLVIRR